MRKFFDGANSSSVILNEECVRVSLSRGRNAESRGEERPDAPVVVAVCQQSPLLQVSQSAAPNQVVLTPLCIDTRCFWSVSLLSHHEISGKCGVTKSFKQLNDTICL